MELPDELWIQVLKLLDVSDLMTVSYLDKYFYNLSKDNILWRSHYRKLAQKLNICKNIKNYRIMYINLYKWSKTVKGYDSAFRRNFTPIFFDEEWIKYGES